MFYTLLKCSNDRLKKKFHELAQRHRNNEFLTYFLIGFN